MNLHGIASGAIGAVNPNVSATLQVSTGSTSNADGSLTPTYAAPVTVTVNFQDLANRDIQHLNGLNIQNATKKAYCYGSVNGIVRDTQQGGDLLTMADGTLWLVAYVFESWPDWCAVALTQQVS